MKTYKEFSIEEWIIIGSAFLIAIFAIGIGLGYITIGVGGITFIF